MTETKLTATKIISRFLKDDPDPPNSKELMALLKATPVAERNEWAKSIDLSFEPLA